MREVAAFANIRIGATATTRYMRDTGKELGRQSRTRPIPPNTTDKLRRLTGKLSRSVTQSGFTAGFRGAESTAGAGRPGPAGMAREGFVRITIEPGPRLRMQKGTNVVYAWIHEFGGTIRIPITKKSRGFFWAMWYETGDDKWKAMALTPKTMFTIRMPARPFLGPALVDEHPNIQKYATDRFGPFIDQHLNVYLP